MQLDAFDADPLVAGFPARAQITIAEVLKRVFRRNCHAVHALLAPDVEVPESHFAEGVFRELLAQTLDLLQAEHVRIGLADPVCDEGYGAQAHGIDVPAGKGQGHEGRPEFV